MHKKILFMSFLPIASVSGITFAQHFQSPINIETARLHSEKGHEVMLHAASRADLMLLNTGSPDPEATVRAIVPAGYATLQIDGEQYELKQFHFHTQSEHTIDGKRFPMEIHSVFQTADGKTAVIGRLVAYGESDKALMPLLENLPQAKGETRPLAHFDLGHLYPANLNYYRYEGSLTTAPYTEGVHWFVLKQPIYLSKDEVSEFARLFPNGDSRELQSLDNRTVFYDGKMTYRHVKS
jgi:carbonic anhydrase